MSNVIIAPSLLSCDFSRIAEEVKAVEEAGADWLHIDVMDGHFVPNITIGPLIVEAIKRSASVPLDVHLMIANPDNYIEDFVEAGADYLTVHQEACTHLHRTVTRIASLGAKPGVALNPATPSETILPVLSELSQVLFMTVNPGFGGQKFIAEVMNKVGIIRRKIDDSGRDTILSVDGGINAETGKLVKQYGITTLIAGNYVFNSSGYKEAIASLR